MAGSDLVDVTTQRAPVAQAERWTQKSCYACSSKKIRCDRKDTCSSCTRAGKVCIYPPLGPRKRKAKAAVMAGMTSRIASLEKSVAKVHEEEDVACSTDHNIPNHILTPALNAKAMPLSKAQGASGDDVLVQNGSSSQYFNEIILSRVIGEERNIASALTPPQPEPPGHPDLSPFNPMGILSTPTFAIQFASLHPSKDVAARLWNIYVDRVEACAGSKLLHIPTHSIKVFSSIDDPEHAPRDDLALSFAVYFAAVVALSHDEVQVFVEQDRLTVLSRFKLGLEQALAHADFLDRPTITGLHALMIYLSVLRVQNHGKGLWVLNGLAARIAQSLGLHRDGERLGLSPFESEMRRRLWWHLISRDNRAGEDYGLENVDTRLLRSEVRLPSNVDDADLFPAMPRRPVSKDHWTTMTNSMIYIELARTQHMLATAATTPSSSGPPTEALRSRIVQETRDHIETLLARCNPVIPQQRLTIFCSRFLLRKLDFVARLQWILLQRAEAQPDFVTDQNLTEALEILELRTQGKGGVLSQYTWASKAYPQYHVTMYVLWHLCVEPEGPNVDRAWKTVSDLSALELWDEGNRGFGSKSAVLAALRTKALSIRTRFRAADSAAEARLGIPSTSQTKTEVCHSRDQAQYPPTDTGELDFDLDQPTGEWPNWSVMLEGFQFDSPNILW